MRDNQIPRLDGPAFPNSRERTDLSFGGGGPVRPFTCRAKGKLGGETRLPMVRKIKQWVPIDGTRWRNEVANGHENHGVGVRYGVAPGGVMAPLRELANTARRCALCGLRHGSPGSILDQTRNRDSRLIEEGPLLPEFVRFESEPWASFYMAGEIIRELRKAA